MGHGDHDQDDEEPRPVAGSTTDATSGTRVACSRSAPSSRATIAVRSQDVHDETGSGHG